MSKLLNLLRSATLPCTGAVRRAEMEREVAAAHELNRAILNTAPVSITVMDENLHVLDCNDSVLKLFGCEKQHYIDRFLDFSPERQPDGTKSGEKALSLVRRALDGQATVFEWMHRTLAGELIHAEVTLTRVKHNERYIVLGYQYDLRNAKKLMDSIRDQSALLKIRLEQQKLTAEIAKSFVSSGDSETLIREALAKLGRHLAVSRVVVIGVDHKRRETSLKYSWHGAGAPSRKAAISNLFDLITTGFPESLPEGIAAPTLSCEDLARSPVEAFHAPTFADTAAFISAPLYVEGRLWGIFSAEQCDMSRVWTENETSFVSMIASVIAGVVMRDIYDKQRAELLEQATAASKAKGDFLSNMSHEMRTPLNAIIGMTAIGKNAEDIEKKNHALNKIGEASSHLLGIINDVLDMAKIEANKLELAPLEYNFDRMLQKVVTVVAFRLDEKRQRLSVNIDNKVPRFIVGDDQRLAQVITNLLSNAVKFTPEEGAIRLEASLVGEFDGNCKLRIEVVDSGIGISPEQQEKLFHAFEQAESGTSREYGGTGLGLVISKRIVELMGGTIWIESEIGKGSRFIFTVNALRGKKSPRSLLASGVNWENVRILVVDDMTETRNQFQALFSYIDIQCDVAADGLEACRIIEEHGAYDIYFIDWRMPGMDGIELARRIKSRWGSKPSVVTMITAADWEQIKDEALDAGVDKHLLKPLFSSMIIDCINECLCAACDQDEDTVYAEGEFEGNRLLLAEDIEINREIFISLLENSKLAIDCAENGREALDMIKAAPDKYDMVLMDVQMPQMDGLEATRRIRALPALQNAELPILAMTANVFKDDIETCLAAGMDDHLGKPLDIDKVFEKLRKYLKRRG